jgi:hypothetical protein
VRNRSGKAIVMLFARNKLPISLRWALTAEIYTHRIQRDIADRRDQIGEDTLSNVKSGPYKVSMLCVFKSVGNSLLGISYGSCQPWGIMYTNKWFRRVAQHIFLLELGKLRDKGL